MSHSIRRLAPETASRIAARVIRVKAGDEHPHVLRCFCQRSCGREIKYGLMLKMCVRMKFFVSPSPSGWAACLAWASKIASKCSVPTCRTTP